MVDIDRVDGVDTTWTVREPRQHRTRQQWARILDAGVRLLEERGYEGFTIAALCERADVPPRALYARAATKDALFLAVYEHGMARVLGGHRALAESATAGAGDLDDRIERAVRQVVRIFVDHADFLRAVVLTSNAHPEVRRRGEAYRGGLQALFTDAVGPLSPDAPGASTGSADPAFCFSLVFSAMVVRTTYGPTLGLPGDVEAVTRELVLVAQRYLVAWSAASSTASMEPIVSIAFPEGAVPCHHHGLR